ncbi:MAG: DUF1700 domain-containing protein [Firmicutes bacterium]|nr:DUF1700 domain-containing protein [Bacillota bacterium]
MNKKAFIQELEKGLKKIGVSDSIDIIKDYEIHFDNEFSKGKSEEEIAKELGSIPDILADFQLEEKTIIQKNKMNVASVIINDIFGYLGIFCMYMLNLVLISQAIVSLILGIYLMFSVDIFSFVPVLVSPFSIFAGFTIVIYSIFSFGFSILMFQSLNKMTKRLTKWNREVLKGEEFERIHVNHSKLIIKIIQISGVVLVIFLIVSYIVAVIMTKEVEFWHYWNWFS